MTEHTPKPILIIEYKYSFGGFNVGIEYDDGSVLWLARNNYNRIEASQRITRLRDTLQIPVVRRQK